MRECRQRNEVKAQILGRERVGFDYSPFLLNIKKSFSMSGKFRVSR